MNVKQVNDKRESSFRGQKWCVLLFFVEHGCHPLDISHYYFIYRYSTAENTLLLISHTFSKLSSIPVHSKCLPLSLTHLLAPFLFLFYCLSLSLTHYLSISVSLSLFLSLTLLLFLSLPLPLPLSLSPFLIIYHSRSYFPSLCLSLSLNIFIFCLCICLPIAIS